MNLQIEPLNCSLLVSFLVCLLRHLAFRRVDRILVIEGTHHCSRHPTRLVRSPGTRRDVVSSFRGNLSSLWGLKELVEMGEGRGEVVGVASALSVSARVIEARHSSSWDLCYEKYSVWVLELSSSAHQNGPASNPYRTMVTADTRNRVKSSKMEHETKL